MGKILNEIKDWWMYDVVDEFGDAFIFACQAILIFSFMIGSGFLLLWINSLK